MPMKKEKKRPDVYVASLDELVKLPIIHAWSVTRCEKSDCPAVHVFLFGANGLPFAHFPMDAQVVSELMRDVCFALDDGKTGKGMH